MKQLIILFMLICGVANASIFPDKFGGDEDESKHPIIIDGRYGDLGSLVVRQEERIKTLENKVSRLESEKQDVIKTLEISPEDLRRITGTN